MDDKAKQLNTWLIGESSPILRTKTKEVAIPLSKNHEKIMERLVQFVIFSQDKKLNHNKIVQPAVGLAAPQIGVSLPMFYIRITEKDELNSHSDKSGDKNLNDEKVVSEHALINPKLLMYSANYAAIRNGEGCLSLKADHQREGYVIRHNKVVISGYDYLKKEYVKITARGYEAIVLQHEYDHLQGKLYFDRINKNHPFEKPENCVLI